MRRINQKEENIARGQENNEHNYQQGTYVDTTSEETVPVSDSESEEDSNPIPKLRNHTPRRSNTLARKTPRYSCLFFCKEGGCFTSAVSELFQRDCCFLSSVNLDNKATHRCPETRYLDKYAYLSMDNIVEDIHLYALSTKVQIHNADNPTYKNILCLPEEDQKL